jgi:chromosome segregation ATPase
MTAQTPAPEVEGLVEKLYVNAWAYGADQTLDNARLANESRDALLALFRQQAQAQAQALAEVTANIRGCHDEIAGLQNDLATLEQQLAAAVQERDEARSALGDEASKRSGYQVHCSRLTLERDAAVARAEQAERKIDEWKTASGLEVNGCPHDVKPKHLERDLEKRAEEARALRKLVKKYAKRHSCGALKLESRCELCRELAALAGAERNGQ